MAEKKKRLAVGTTKPLPKKGPLPDYPTWDAFVYHYLICGNYKRAYLLANYQKKGIRPGGHGADRQLWKKPGLQNRLREVIENMASGKKKIKLKRVTQSTDEHTVPVKKPRAGDGSDGRTADKDKRTMRPTNTPQGQIETVEELIATAEEVLRYLTSCMRGKIPEEVYMSRMTERGHQIIEKLQKQTSPSDRTKAAELLAKRYGLLDNKYSIDLNVPVIFKGEDSLGD